MANVTMTCGGWDAVTEDADPDRVVVSLHGSLDIDGAPDLRHYLLGLVRAPIVTLTLDVSALAFVDQADVALFYVARRDAERDGVELRVVPTPDRRPD
jgi:anti-anti-sigma regulatory factor